VLDDWSGFPTVKRSKRQLFITVVDELRSEAIDGSVPPKDEIAVRTVTAAFSATLYSAGAGRVPHSRFRGSSASLDARPSPRSEH
jgi:hypothetical protein